MAEGGEGVAGGEEGKHESVKLHVQVPLRLLPLLPPPQTSVPKYTNPTPPNNTNPTQESATMPRPGRNSAGTSGAVTARKLR